MPYDVQGVRLRLSASWACRVMFGVEAQLSFLKTPQGTGHRPCIRRPSQPQRASCRAPASGRSSIAPWTACSGAPPTRGPDRTALVVPSISRRVLTLCRIRPRRSSGSARGMIALRPRAGRAHRHLGAELPRVGADDVRARRAPGLMLVNINPAYRRLRARVRAAPRGLPGLVFAPRFKSSDYGAMLHVADPGTAAAAPGRLQCAAFPELRAAGAT